GLGHLRRFRLEAGLPVWTYEVAGYRIEKRVLLAHLQNTVHVLFRLLEEGDGGPLRIEVQPTVHIRPHDAPVSTPLGTPFTLTVIDDRYEICSSWPGMPPLRLQMSGGEVTFTVAQRTLHGVHYAIEERRGYEAVGDLWCPGFFGADLGAGEEAALVASTEPWEVVRALRSGEALAGELERRERLLVAAALPARRGTAAELVLAADQFIVTPGRAED